MPDPVVPTFIRELSIQGFRAYLAPKTFKFTSKRSLAVFAPNGSGKSSIVDALEFMFSTDGTLTRLGQRTIHNYAGPTALAHNRAAERNITPRVSVTFRQGNSDSSGVREATGNRARPAAATAVRSHFTVDPIIRGHSLRRFVEEQKAEDRYAEVASWLHLTPLVAVQRNLRNLRSQIKQSAEDPAPLSAIDREIARETANVVTKWDDEAALEFVNERVLAPLDKSLRLNALAVDEPSYDVVKERAVEEEKRVGLGALKQARDALTAVYQEEVNEETGEVLASGALSTFEAAIARHADAVRRENEERGKAADAVFEAIWKAAEPLFAEGQPALDSCPVCETPIAASAAGSIENIRANLARHRTELATYSAAKSELAAAGQAVSQAEQRVVARVEAIPTTAREAHEPLRSEADQFLAELRAKPSELPETARVKEAILAATSRLAELIAEIEEKQGEHTYAKARAKIDELIRIAADRDRVLRETKELEKLHDALDEQASFVSGEIRKAVQRLLDSLRTPVNAIYAAIQGPGAVPVRLELPPEDDTNQQRLNLLVDFADNRVGVQPSGYLSDSQIHSLALALRLAAIQRFNPEAPIAILDDIVTSYDADHRRLIAALFANHFEPMQLIITTHDQRFFEYLKDQLPPPTWQFAQILRIDPNVGPIFSDHKVSDELIEERWAEGKSAANEMRQAEEEWLVGKCREFRAKVDIRSVEKAHSYERSELAEALANYLKKAGLVPEPVPGVANRFLDSLQRGTVENFGSHFQDAQYGGGSIGDEKARWAEFVAFRDQFSCPKCKRTKFIRPRPLEKPVCAHQKCQAPFEFASGGEKAA